MEIKTVLLKNGKFNIMLINTEKCILVDSVLEVEYNEITNEIGKLLKRFF